MTPYWNSDDRDYIMSLKKQKTWIGYLLYITNVYIHFHKILACLSSSCLSSLHKRLLSCFSAVWRASPNCGVESVAPQKQLHLCWWMMIYSLMELKDQSNPCYFEFRPCKSKNLNLVVFLSCFLMQNQVRISGKQFFPNVDWKNCDSAIIFCCRFLSHCCCNSALIFWFFCWRCCCSMLLSSLIHLSDRCLTICSFAMNVLAMQKSMILAATACIWIQYNLLTYALVAISWSRAFSLL